MKLGQPVGLVSGGSTEQQADKVGRSWVNVEPWTVKKSF